MWSGCQKKFDSGKKTKLVVVSFGGDWQTAQRKAIFEPFERKYNVDIVEVEYNGDYSLIKEKARKGEWDVVDVEPAELLMGSRDGIYEPIDYTKINRDELVPEAIHEYGLGVITYAIVMGYSSELFKPGKPHPSTWTDFWNTKEYPGKRGLHNSPQWMFEIALLSQGTPKNQLYPIDIGKALAQLDRIKSQTIFFETWAQPAQLIQRGEVSMTAGTNGRLLAAKQEGLPIEISWEQGIITVEYYVVPKGLKNKDLAMKFIAFAASAEGQKDIPKYIAYGPTNRKAMVQVDPSLAKNLPTAKENYSKLVAFNPEWWLKNKSEAIRRYNEWALK
jgi:putative spermidine/putrescine transport system substrate-binding protein